MPNENEMITQYNQTAFLESRTAHLEKTASERWGERVDLVVKQIEVLKLDADPSWDVYNHLDDVVDRLTEAIVYASAQDHPEVD